MISLFSNIGRFIYLIIIQVQRVFLTQRHSLQVVTPGKWKTLPSSEARLYENADAIKASHDAYIME